MKVGILEEWNGTRNPSTYWHMKMKLWDMNCEKDWKYVDSSKKVPADHIHLLGADSSTFDLASLVSHDYPHCTANW